MRDMNHGHRAVSKPAQVLEHLDDLTLQREILPSQFGSRSVLAATESNVLDDSRCRRKYRLPPVYSQSLDASEIQKLHRLQQAPPRTRER